MERWSRGAVSISQNSSSRGGCGRRGNRGNGVWLPYYYLRRLRRRRRRRPGLARCRAVYVVGRLVSVDDKCRQRRRRRRR